MFNNVDVIRKHIKINEDNFALGSSIINLIRKDNKLCIVVESDNRVNPTDYTNYIYSKIKEYLNNTDCVYLDLSNLYGTKSKNWFHKWKFIVDKNNNLYDEEFISVDNLKIEDKDEYEMIKGYLYNKLRYIG